jgi:glycosyltransferase involved in cell wall biosynthesis
MREELVNATPVRPSQLDKDFGKFVFAAGRDDPRKNLNIAIKSFLSCESVNAEFKMVVLGLSEQKYLERHLDYEPSNVVVFVDRCSDDELCWLYQNATLFVFISLDEGFGMPVLESLFFKTPSLVSDIEVFKEITGGNTNFADPRSMDSVRQSLNSILESTPSPHQNEMPREIFSWKNSVEVLRNASK